jgi:hypothetical protein
VSDVNRVATHRQWRNARNARNTVLRLLRLLRPSRQVGTDRNRYRIELFARGAARPGWTVWGNQTGETRLAEAAA